MAGLDSGDNFDFNDLDYKLHSALYRADCPSILQLGEYTLDLLSPAMKEDISYHLQSCLHCREELSGLQDFKKVPFRHAEPDARNVLPFRVQSYSRETPALAAVRSGEANRQSRKLTIALGRNSSLVLFYKIAREAAGYILSGQFVPSAACESSLDQALVEFWEESEIRTTCRVDELFAFCVRLLALSPLIMRISNAQGTLCAIRLDLQEG